MLKSGYPPSRQQGLQNQTEDIPQRYMQDREYDMFQIPKKYQQEQANQYDQTRNQTQQNISNLRLYITLKKRDDENIDYKKIILMTQSSVKISMLKRQIEKEFTDLFPKEPPFICGKLEDEYGYSLSNNSYVSEMLKNGDRLYAQPEDLLATGPDGQLAAIGGDIQELLYMLKCLQQTICSKLADSNMSNYQDIEEVLIQMTPLGFSQSKIIVHNVAFILNKLFSTERLELFENKNNQLLNNIIITLITYWLSELVAEDNFLLNSTIDLLDILCKSAAFCQLFKSPGVINDLMGISKLDSASTQIRARIIRLITYLSRGDFRNGYNPKYINENISQPEYPRRIRQQSAYNQSNNNMLSNSKIQNQNNFKNDMQNQEEVGAIRVDNEYLRIPSRRGQQKISKGPQVAESNQFDKKNVENQRYKQLNFKRETASEHLYKDYIQLLSEDNTQDMQIFGVQNLDTIIEDVAGHIMDDKESYIRCLNLMELNMQIEFQPAQVHILETLNKYLIERRALDGLRANVVQRALRAFNLQPTIFHNTLYSLIQNHLYMGKYRVDVATLVQMITSQQSKLQELAIKIMAQISDANFIESSHYDQQFENHIKLLLDLSINMNKPQYFRSHVLQTISNLTIKENLKPIFLNHKVIDYMLKTLRDDDNLEGQRMAAKALLNISVHSRDTKLSIVTELADEIKKIHKGELDSIVATYISTIVHTRDYLKEEKLY